MALGQEQNTNKVNEPGAYKDHQSGAELTVTMYAAADALVRLGWERIGDVDPEQLKDPYAEVKEEVEAEAPAEPKTKAKVKK